MTRAILTSGHGLGLTEEPDWRKGDKPAEESTLLAMFADHPQAPFSIHRFVECGATSCGKFPGEWFGPSATARCIQYVSSRTSPGAKLTKDYRKLSSDSETPHVRVYVTNDTSDVYEDQFTRLARDGTGDFQPTLILLGLRLGIENITSVYWDGLRAVLQLPQSVGVAGYVSPQRPERESG